MERNHERKPILELPAQPAPALPAESDGTQGPQEPVEKHEPSYESTDAEDHSDAESQRPNLHHVRSHVSTHDTAEQPPDYEQGDETYDRFPSHRKIIAVAVLSLCAFLAPISSTSILSASPEVVATFNTTPDIFNVSNALYLVFMGLSPLFWGPMGTTFGRRWPLIIAAVSFTAFSLGSALAPNLAAYFVFRVLTAFEGTVFLIVGGTVIGDLYRPIERGTFYGYFFSGTLVGPALGPFIGGIIVTYVSWRVIFWLQTALAGLATTLVFFFVPETIHYAKKAELHNLTRKEKASKLWKWLNPMRVVMLFRYPNLLVVGIASSSLVWNMYSLLTPIRYVLNPRFGLSTPMESGLFYIAPGAGYLTGTFFGGRWADRVMKKYIAKRGRRVPEDRLNSCLTSIGVVIPACMILYGWSIEKKVGGIALPVIVMFIQGVAQLMCFPSLNTYCLDVMQGRSAEVVAGNYMVRYAFAAAGSAACLPVIDRIGVGWFSTISAVFMVLAAVGVWLTTKYGEQWRQRTDSGKQTEE